MEQAPTLPPDFVDLLTEFAASNVRYLVIGGYAVGFHDRPRATKDLDVLQATWNGLAKHSPDSADRDQDRVDVKRLERRLNREP